MLGMGLDFGCSLALEHVPSLETEAGCASATAPHSCPCFAVPVVKPTVLPGTKALPAVAAQAAAAQKNKLKEPGGGSFR